jgi:regulatory protein
VTQPRSRRRTNPTELRERRAAVEDVATVLDAAARFLEVRSRSVAEVRRRLTSAGYQGPLVDAAIEQLTRQGYLDDGSFARAWVASRDRSRPRGERALRLELRSKGIDRALIDEVVAERGGHPVAGDGADVRDKSAPDEAAASRLLERRARTLARELDPIKRRQRAYALLARNGFDPDVSRRVAASVTELGTLPDDADETATSDSQAPSR